MLNNLSDIIQLIIKEQEILEQLNAYEVKNNTPYKLICRVDAYCSYDIGEFKGLESYELIKDEEGYFALKKAYEEVRTKLSLSCALYSLTKAQLSDLTNRVNYIIKLNNEINQKLKDIYQLELVLAKDNTKYSAITKKIEELTSNLDNLIIEEQTKCSLLASVFPNLPASSLTR